MILIAALAAAVVATPPPRSPPTAHAVMEMQRRAAAPRPNQDVGLSTAEARDLYARRLEGEAARVANSRTEARR